MGPMKIAIIIPALNEELSIAGVVSSVINEVDRVIVVDNGSTDKTARAAEAAGAKVVYEPIAGYGRSCLAGVAAAADAGIYLFMDGDGADDPVDLPKIVTPILEGTADRVIGSRLTGDVDAGALTLPQQFGNSLACTLMRIFWNGKFTDHGPFRAIDAKAYRKLDMAALTFGWTIEMQVRALKRGLRCLETPVHYRRRIGVSKISGTLRGVVFAGGHILGVIGREILIDIANAVGLIPSGNDFHGKQVARKATPGD